MKCHVKVPWLLAFNATYIVTHQSLALITSIGGGTNISLWMWMTINVTFLIFLMAILCHTTDSVTRVYKQKCLEAILMLTYNIRCPELQRYWYNWEQTTTSSRYNLGFTDIKPSNKIKQAMNVLAWQTTKWTLASLVVILFLLVRLSFRTLK